MQAIVIFSANYLYLASITIGFYGLFFAPRELQINLIKLAFFSLPLSLIIGKIANYFFENLRPFVLNREFPLIPHAPDNGFPSDHMLLAATIASVVFIYRPSLGILLFVIALLVGASRVLAKIHHPIDIFGSIAISIIAVLIAKFLASQVKFNL